MRNHAATDEMANMTMTHNPPLCDSADASKACRIHARAKTTKFSVRRTRGPPRNKLLGIHAHAHKRRLSLWAWSAATFDLRPPGQKNSGSHRVQVSYVVHHGKPPHPPTVWDVAFPPRKKTVYQDSGMRNLFAGSQRVRPPGRPNP